ncbi:unnamed protein product [Cuscuta epithymum]|uniref:Uncharacterized protein n=1 Tax=Cuscuta epithymum TaxID=186058 RepID=A0AAV0CDH7_9ASTE|nr:unnamed protein product [Cuscuta epithymum]
MAPRKDKGQSSRAMVPVPGFEDLIGSLSRAGTCWDESALGFLDGFTLSNFHRFIGFWEK